jgi:hypothetical protein
MKNMKFNNFFQSKTFKIIIWVVVALIVLLLVFRLGIEVGYKKAQFSYHWGENYHLNFGGPKGGFFLPPNKNDEFISSHGAAGQIIKIDNNNLIIKDQENVEKSILIKDDTTIFCLRQKIKASDLKTGDFIVVIGDPNNAGQIEAKLIRVMPSPAQINNGVPGQNTFSPKFLRNRLPR